VLVFNLVIFFSFDINQFRFIAESSIALYHKRRISRIALWQYRMSIHHFLHFSTLDDNERLSLVLFFLLFFSLNKLLISLIDLILMILSHQSLIISMLLLYYFVLKLHTLVISFVRLNRPFILLFARSLFARSFSVLLFSLALCSLIFSLLSRFFCLFVARFKIKSKKDNKNVRLIRIKINNIRWYHVFMTYFIWNNKMSSFFVIVYLKRFKLFFWINSTRIAKSRRDLFVIWSNSRFCDIKTRIKKLALRNNKNESMSFKTNSCLFFFEKYEDFSLFVWW
jgi:hypothetical protein